MAKHGDSPAGIGVITVFTILILLCMAVFSALTLSSARRMPACPRPARIPPRSGMPPTHRAAQLAEEFAASGEAELETTVPISDTRELYLHLVREEDGTVTVLAWQTRTLEGGGDEGTLELWDGTGTRFGARKEP